MSNNAMKTVFALLAVITACQSSLAKTYVIRKLNTPSIIINKTELKVGDRFNDGAVIHWSNAKQYMRVVSDDSELLTLYPDKSVSPVRMTPILANKGKLSNRAFCTSLADHKAAFEGEESQGHTLIDTLSISSGWRQDDRNFFCATFHTADADKTITLPYTDKGEVIFTYDIIPEGCLKDEDDVTTVCIIYHNARTGEDRVVTSEMKLRLLPDEL